MGDADIDDPELTEIRALKAKMADYGWTEGSADFKKRLKLIQNKYLVLAKQEAAPRPPAALSGARPEKPRGRAGFRWGNKDGLKFEEVLDTDDWAIGIAVLAKWTPTTWKRNPSAPGNGTLRNFVTTAGGRMLYGRVKRVNGNLLIEEGQLKGVDDVEDDEEEGEDDETKEDGPSLLPVPNTTEEPAAAASARASAAKKSKGGASSDPQEAPADEAAPGKRKRGAPKRHS
jgi:hypothetical protein